MGQAPLGVIVNAHAKAGNIEGSEHWFYQCKELTGTTPECVLGTVMLNGYASLSPPNRTAVEELVLYLEWCRFKPDADFLACLRSTLGQARFSEVCKTTGWSSQKRRTKTDGRFGQKRRANDMQKNLDKFNNP